MNASSRLNRGDNNSFSAQSHARFVGYTHEKSAPRSHRSFGLDNARLGNTETYRGHGATTGAPFPPMPTPYTSRTKGPSGYVTQSVYCRNIGPSVALHSYEWNQMRHVGAASVDSRRGYSATANNSLTLSTPDSQHMMYRPSEGCVVDVPYHKFDNRLKKPHKTGHYVPCDNKPEQNSSELLHHFRSCKTATRSSHSRESDRATNSFKHCRGSGTFTKSEHQKAIGKSPFIASVCALSLTTTHGEDMQSHSSAQVSRDCRYVFKWFMFVQLVNCWGHIFETS